VRVSALWRFPVKSMRGESIEVADLDVRGVVGDRRFGVADAVTGVVLTAKRHPVLLQGAASWKDGEVVVRDTDGCVLADDEALSAWVGQPVRLVAGDPAVASHYQGLADNFDDASAAVAWQGPLGAFHDSSRRQVSLVSVPALDGWDLRRFRMNVLLDEAGDDVLVGTRIRIGTVSLAVVKQIDRCVMVTGAQAGGVQRDLDVLRTIHRERDGCVGVGALVETVGHIAVGDEVV
jgi:uncharacterized protein YcbX